MTNRTKLERIEQRVVGLSRRAVDTTRPALLESVLAKAERALRGEALEPADWTNARPDVVAHRERLLEWARTKQS